MNKARTISVIMPTYNKAATIKESLVPILEQDGLIEPYEVIVVDNQSTDDTLHVLEQLVNQYSHLRYVVEPRRGPGAARNRGILESQGRLLIFLDDDIVVLPDHITRHQAHHRCAEGWTCVVGYVENRSQSDSAALRQYIRTRSSITTARTPSHAGGLALAAGNFSILRDAIEQVRFDRDGRVQYFDEAFRVRQDGELGYRLEKAGIAFDYTRDIHCEHRQYYQWSDMVQRAYLSGYYLERLFAKHREARDVARHKIVRNPVLNILLLVTGAVALGVGYLVRWVSPWPMLKGIGACLLYHSSRGYQQAMREHFISRSQG